VCSRMFRRRCVEGPELPVSAPARSDRASAQLDWGPFCGARGFEVGQCPTWGRGTTFQLWSLSDFRVDRPGGDKERAVQLPVMGNAVRGKSDVRSRGIQSRKPRRSLAGGREWRRNGAFPKRWYVFFIKSWFGRADFIIFRYYFQVPRSTAARRQL
jgi:hypothetical protein